MVNSVSIEPPESAPLPGEDPKIEEILQYYRNGWRPPPDFSIADWSDEKRELPRESADEAGRWRTARTPYLREIMDELSPRSHTEEVVFMKGSQIGATESAINTIFFYIDHVPCPILLIEPTVDVAKKVSKTRIAPSIRDCSVIRAKVIENKSRDSGNTILEKDFPGGQLIIGGANSAASMRSMPIRIIIFDEEDGYPDDVDGEGDPVELGERRATNFSRSKKFHISTPTLLETSRIYQRFKESDRRYYYVPCPHCKEKQIITWDSLKFDNKDPDTARMVCKHCKKDIPEYYKTQMLENGEWRKHNPGSKVAGFHLSAFYSPEGWYSWRTAVKDWLKAQGKPTKLKVWFNTVAGEPWEDKNGSIDKHWIAKRPRFSVSVPSGVLCIVNGTDTQDDRLESTTVGIGWSGGVESWVLDHSVFFGNPAQTSVWNLLDQHLMKEWIHENGTRMQVAATGIDAMGHFTEEVYKFCGARQHRRIFPMKGMAGAGRPLVVRGSKNAKYHTYLFHTGTYSAKETLYARLMITEPGPGYIHFSDKLQESYFEQLVSERKRTILHHGLPHVEWELPAKVRNEALDCFVLSMCALHVLNPNLELMAQENRVFQSDLSRPMIRRKPKILSKGVRV
jgi:phage terminase large subunit GpA-like protein